MKYHSDNEDAGEVDDVEGVERGEVVWRRGGGEEGGRSVVR